MEFTAAGCMECRESRSKVDTWPDDSTFEATVDRVSGIRALESVCPHCDRVSDITLVASIFRSRFLTFVYPHYPKNRTKNHPLNGCFGFLMNTGKIRTFLPAEFLLWMPSIFLCNFFSRNCGSQSGHIKGWSRKLLYNLITKFHFLNDLWRMVAIIKRIPLVEN